MKISILSNKKVFAIFFILMLTLLVDVTIGSSQDLLSDFALAPEGMMIFIVIAAISIFAQLYIIEAISRSVRQGAAKWQHFGTFANVTRGVQILLGAIMVSIIVQIMATGGYSKEFLMGALAISYGLVIALSSVLSYKFFSWFRINKSLIVLLYGIASTMIAINSVDTIVLFEFILSGKPSIVTAASEVIYEGNFEEGHPMYPTTVMMNITQTSYFLLIWSATVLLLYHNIKRIGKARFWGLVIPPILFFMSFYISFYETILPPNPNDVPPPLMVYILLVIYSMIAAGVFFGVGFLSIARFPKLQSHVKNYMFITGYAFVLFIISSISVIGQAGYPPFGLASVTTVGLASFLMLSGLYTSAATVSQDVRLRQLIRTSAKEESKLLDSIGSAEMQGEVEKRVIAIVRRNADVLTEKSNIKYSMSDQEIADYLTQAAEELKRRTRSGGQS